MGNTAEAPESRGKRKSVKRYLSVTAVITFILLISAVFLTTVYSAWHLRSETASQYTSILSMQMNTIDTQLGTTASTLVSYKMFNENMSALAMAQSRGDAAFAIGKIRQEITNQMLPSSLAETVYVRRRMDKFDLTGIALSSTSTFSAYEKRDLEQYVSGIDINSASTDYMWQPVKIGDNWYFVYCIQGPNYILGEGVRAEKILNMFVLDLTDGSYLTILDDQNNPMTETGSAQNAVHWPSFVNSRASYWWDNNRLVIGTYSKGLHRKVFFVRAAGMDRNYTTVLHVLIICLVAVAVITIVQSRMLLRSVKKPLQRMNKMIAHVRNGNLETQIAIGDDVTEEYLETYRTMNDLIVRINELKIASYESELKRKQYQIQFLALQIEPHFYLNSMKYIYALAETQQYRKLQELVLSMSRYFRYLTYDTNKMVPFSEELDHSENYLAIINSGSINKVTADISVENKAEKVLVPKLLVQTFIENAVKYAGSEGSPLIIEISARVAGEPDEQFLYMNVTDNGRGFNGQYLKQIHENGFEANNGHVGLSNLYHRLQLLYQDENVYMNIANNTNGGAKINVIIPARFQQTEETGRGIER